MTTDNEATPETLETTTSRQTEPVVVKNHRLSSIMPIVVFSFLGTLIRLSLNFLGNNQAPLAASFWPNFIGCFIMGFVVEQKIHIQHHFSQLYIGLTTGLCGSITTFSGVMYNSCLALFGPSSHETYPVSNYLSVIVAIFSSSYMGFLIGRHLSIVVFSSFSSLIRRNFPYLNETIAALSYPALIVFIILVLILLAALLPCGSYTYFIYSLIFAPFGSLTRYLLSILFNTNPNFPLGTLLANTFGSFLYFGIVAINIYAHIPSMLVRQILLSLIQGYCGCLTTVSTLILELNTIEKRKWLYFYIVLTVFPVQILFIIFANVFSLLCSSRS